MKPYEIETAGRLLHDLDQMNQQIGWMDDLSITEIRFSRRGAMIDDRMKEAIIGAMRAEMHRRRMETAQKLAALGVEIEEGGAA